MKRLRSENRPLDDTDMRLLRALADDARITVTRLARTVGLSPPSVSERMKRLEEDGGSEGDAAKISPRALGFPVAAWLRVRPRPGQLQKVSEILQELPQIVECDRVTGEDCFIARAYAASVEDLQRL